MAMTLCAEAMRPLLPLARQRYKVIVLGAPGAGKTALVRRFADGSFIEGPRQRGLDFYTCQIQLRDDVSVTLQLWDLSDCPTRPADDHGPLSNYIFNSQAVLFLYDVSAPSTLEDLRYTLCAVEAANGATGGARPYFGLVATKCDLRWGASEPLARELAARHSCVRFALSAKTGQGVTHAAVQLACDLAGVPLAATDYRDHFAAEAPFGPGPDAVGGPLGAAAPDANAALSDPIRAASGSSCPRPTSPSASTWWPPLHARAPLYQKPETPGAGADRLDEVCLRSLGGGGAGGQPWRPVSRKASSGSQAMMVISKTGPLGQRISARSGTPDAGPGGQPGSEGKGTEQTAAQQPVTGDSGERSAVRGWRMLCCGGGRR